MARGEFLVAVQGDTCLPTSQNWLLEALILLRRLPKLALLSGRAGYSEVLTREMNASHRNERIFGHAPYLPITHELVANKSSNFEGEGIPFQTAPIPFMFTPGVDNGPLIFRREALLRRHDTLLAPCFR